MAVNKIWFKNERAYPTAFNPTSVGGHIKLNIKQGKFYLTKNTEKQTCEQANVSTAGITECHLVTLKIPQKLKELIYVVVRITLCSI